MFSYPQNNLVKYQITQFETAAHPAPAAPCCALHSMTGFLRALCATIEGQPCDDRILEAAPALQCPERLRLCCWAEEKEGDVFKCGVSN